MSTLEKPYGNRRRPGHKAARTAKGDPRKAARQQRAYDRGAPRPKEQT